MRFSCLLAAALLACAGDAGQDGSDGRDGSDGEDGAPGLSGDAGPAGERGATGPRGEPGVDGRDGVDGARGPVGSQGDQGPPGADGASGGYHPSLWFHCEKQHDLVLANGTAGQDGTRETLLAYGVTRFSNGDAATKCEAAIGSAESATGGEYIPEPDSASAGAACFAAVDMPPTTDATAGAWAFAISPAQHAPAAVYSDAVGHPLRGTVLPFADADCSVQLGASDGSWTAGALADVVD